MSAIGIFGVGIALCKLEHNSMFLVQRGNSRDETILQTLPEAPKVRKRRLQLACLARFTSPSSTVLLGTSSPGCLANRLSIYQDGSRRGNILVFEVDTLVGRRLVICAEHR